MLKNIFSILFLLLILGSCHKDVDSGETIITAGFMPEILEEINGSILGYVYDDQNQPVSEALVQIYGAITKTNQFGAYIFKNVNLDKHGTYIRVKKNGFMTGSDMVYPNGGLSYSRIKMITLKNDKFFDGKNGGEVEISGGGKLIFPTDVIVDQNNNPHSGKVLVTAKLLKPNSLDLIDEMPGALYGFSNNGTNVVLGTAGMIAVELQDVNGKKLQVAPGKKVKFTIPALSESKPATIPLWHFDEEKGLWLEEGEAELIDGNYVGEVSHFSFWNCDAPFPLIHVCGKVLDQDGKPLKSIRVQVGVQGLGVSFGYTDENGVFCGKMPKGKILNLKVSPLHCNLYSPIFETSVGPFDVETQLDPFLVTLPTTWKVEGQVLCETDFVEESVLVAIVNGFRYIIYTDEQGRFNIDGSVLTCSNNAEVSFFAFNYLTNEASETRVENTSNMPFLVLDICPEAGDLEGSISYDCDKTLMVNATGGSGNYTYLWSGGQTTQIIQLSNDSLGGIYCVTITDATNSDLKKIFCKEVYGKIIIFGPNECESPTSVEVLGGSPPMQYLWHNGATTKSVILPSGESYCVTVSDSQGCSAVKCGFFEELYLDSNIASCNGHLFNIYSSPFVSGNIYIQNSPGPGGTTIPISYTDNLSVFQTGFNFSIFLNGANCFVDNFYRLPQFSGLAIEKVDNTTCGTCNDGHIEFKIDQQSNCLNCVAGEIKVYNINNLTNDLSGLNQAKMLPKGEYYVVMEDLNSKCVIAFKKAKVE